MSKFRNVVTFKWYFEDFFSELPKKVQKKFLWTFELIEDLEQIPEIYLKHISDGIYEIRVKFGTNIYRVFAFFDEQQLVIAMNGFQKKTRKTPRNEIDNARKIRYEYYSEK